MCEIAPFFMTCEFEDVRNNLISCNVHRLNCAAQELKMSLPLIGGWFKPYECPMFVPKGDNDGTK